MRVKGFLSVLSTAGQLVSITAADAAPLKDIVVSSSCCARKSRLCFARRCRRGRLRSTELALDNVELDGAVLKHVDEWLDFCMAVERG